MKKITALACSLLMIGCAKNSDKIDALKANLKKDYGKSEAELQSYIYSVREAFPNEVFPAIMENKIKQSENYAELGKEDEVNKITAQIDSLSKAKTADKDKVFYAVHVFKVADNDTIKNITYYLNDKNDILAVKSKK